jgi:hypothetical protein
MNITLRPSEPLAAFFMSIGISAVNLTLKQPRKSLN